MRELRKLILPELVESKRVEGRATSKLDSPSLHHNTPLHLSHSSMSSDPQSPTTPIFSPRNYSRFPSANSSLASSPTMRESIDGYAPKRPLTEVKEEPQQEKEMDFEMLDLPSRSSDDTHHACSGSDHFATFIDSDLSSSTDYDWVDSPSFDDHEFVLAASKRQRGGDTSPTWMASRLSSRFPSLTRKLTSKDKKGQRSCSSPDSVHESVASRSRASSIRSPSLLDTRTDSLERREVQIPLTPNQSFIIESPDEMHGNNATSVSDLPDDDLDGYEAPEALARTPLLPPVMAMLRTTDEPVQSPLQSPKVADSPNTSWNPMDSPSVYSGLPSPPLSTKPSISSFHHRAIVPSAEIPPIRLAEPQDEWALKLGHANFTIYPEPYLPASPPDAAACKKLRTDWDTAGCEFTKHLARTGEHYSTTSKVYQLTEEKWSALNATWKRYYEQTLASIAPESQEALEFSQHSLHEPAPPAKMPLISSQGEKFPKVGELGIVGPMQQAKPVLAQRPSRKRAFWKFLQGVLPSSVAFGRAQA